MKGDAQYASLRLGCIPVGSFRGRFEHPQLSRLASKQTAPQCKRILSASVGDFVDETLHEEGLMRMADTAPKPNRDRAGNYPVRDLLRPKE